MERRKISMGGISGLSKIHCYNANGNDIGNDDDNDNIMKERERGR